MNTIQTNRGSIDIIEPSNEMIGQLNDLLPYGLFQLNQVVYGAKYGFVFKNGEQEVLCIKQQPLEIERKQAELQYKVHNFMIIEAYCHYLKNGFSGAYLAAPYLRQRDNGLWETGVSHFIFPSKTNIVTSEKYSNTAFDYHFGKGATVMFSHFVDCFKNSFSESKITMPQYFGLDVRTHSHLQGLEMNFMVFNSQIICLRADLREQDDAAWTLFSSRGIKKIYHLPSVTLTVSKTDVDSKPSQKMKEQNRIFEFARKHPEMILELISDHHYLSNQLIEKYKDKWIWDGFHGLSHSSNL